MVGDINTYNLRNQLDYATVARRLEIYSKSVIPSSIKLWNDLDIEVRNSDTLFSFKRTAILAATAASPTLTACIHTGFATFLTSSGKKENFCTKALCPFPLRKRTGTYSMLKIRKNMSYKNSHIS